MRAIDRSTEGNDGSDYNYRMVIEDRYKRLATLRRRIKFTAIAQLVYVLLRSGWKSLPLALGFTLDKVDLLVLGAGLGLFVLYRFASGFGKAQRERRWAIMVYSVGSLFLAAECFLTFWIYHVIWGADSADPAAAKAYPPLPRMAAALVQKHLNLSSVGHDVAFKVFDIYEKAFEVIGMAAVIAGVVTTRDYINEMKGAHSKDKNNRVKEN